jgi:tRNA (mo5U34)-methyltransferase
MSVATDPQFHKLTQDQVSRLSKKDWYHSIRLPDGQIIPGLITVEALELRVRRFGIPADLRGKRVLDIGAATGWNSFEMERRGANVVAVDCVEYEEFRTAAQLLNSKVDYCILDMEEITPQTVGTFDYVLFFGVLYHLRHPLLGLERLCSVTRDTAFVESYVYDGKVPVDEPGPQLMEFYETTELGGQIDNWFGPSTGCMMAMCRSAGFASVDFSHLEDRRGAIICRRTRSLPPPDPQAAMPRITGAVNNRTNDIYFHPHKDEYICIYFKTAEALTRDRLYVEIDHYGAPILLLSELGQEGWQANLRLPPGIGFGPHAVRIRTVNSGFSNAFQIIVGDNHEAPAKTASIGQAPDLYRMQNNMDESAVFRGYKSEYLCCFFRSGERDLSRDEVAVLIKNFPAPAQFLTEIEPGSWQLNARLPKQLAPGIHSVSVSIRGGPSSNALEFQFEPE